VNFSHAKYNLYEGNKGSLDVSAQLQTALFSQSHSNFGAPTKSDNIWWEVQIEPSLKGHLNVYSNSQLYGEFSYIYAQTWGTDPLGYKGNIDRGLIEQAYIGWRSGKMFDYKENLIDISAGFQDYKIGHGFMIWNSGASGDIQPSYWLGGKHAFKNTVIIKITTDILKLDLFTIESGKGLEMKGFNTEITPIHSTVLGFTYLNIKDLKMPNSIIDGMNVYDFRLDINNIPHFEDFSLMSEYALEKNNNLVDSYAWYSSFSWKFSQFNWKPTVTYRYAFFKGDDPSSKISESYVPLRYAFTDWNSWYIGEIMGEYIGPWNSNLKTHTLSLKVHPTKDLMIGLFILRFTIDQPESIGVESTHYADEIDFVVDWKINNSFSTSFVLADAIPGKAAAEHLGGNKNWLLGMLYGKYTF